MKRGKKPIDYPAIHSPTINDIREVALLYEGEGSISFVQDQITMQMGQNDREILDRYQPLFGGKVYGPYINSVGNDFYMWRMVRERALGFMFTIYSWLSSNRRRQFEAVLKGKNSGREYRATISEAGISQAWFDRKLNAHNKKKAKLEEKRRKDPMHIFGFSKYDKT